MRKIRRRLGVVATLALVLVTFTACSAPPSAGYSSSSGSSAPAAPAAKSGSDPAPAPTTAPVQDNSSPSQPLQAPLTAGVIDDNSSYADYLAYAANRNVVHYALPMNLTARRFVKVVDSKGQPIADASVSLLDGSRPVFSGRTTSDGRMAFFSHTVDDAQTQSLTVNVSRDGASASGHLDLGQSDNDTTPITLTSSSAVNSLDIAFLLDSTGSMDDEIDRIKATISTISQRISRLPGAPTLRLGLVTYRDRGDDYVTKSWDFTPDVATFAANLNNIEAGGGGDTPEDFNAGLSDTLTRLSWSAEQQHALRLVFLVTDAAPHTDYGDETQYDTLLKQAVGMGIKIFPIGASGLDDDGEYAYRQVAAYTLAKFVFLTYANGSSGASGMATNLSVSQYSTANLDDLIVNLVAAEVANQQRNFSQQPAQATTYQSSAPSGPSAKGGDPSGIAAAILFIMIILRGILAGSLTALLLLLIAALIRRFLRSRPNVKQLDPSPYDDESGLTTPLRGRSLIPTSDHWNTALPTAPTERGRAKR